MALDLSGFVTAPQKFEGLYAASETLERRKVREDQLAQQKEGRVAANTKFLTDYLDPKDRLTGTNYDPEIVKQLQETLQEGAALAAKGANTADIMMALGPKVNKINEYSTKAKLVQQQVKSSLDKLKGYGGYNIAALEDEAKKLAFQDEKGALKDISLVDPQTDWVTEATRLKPEIVTTGAGLDEFVKKTPTATIGRSVSTSKFGRTKNVKYEATHPFWMDLKQDEKGQIATDPMGNPVGLDIVGGPIMGDDNKPMLNPTTGEPFRGLHKKQFTAIMQHNPDIADYMRGQINKYFKEAGAEKIPDEGSPQWLAMGQHLLGEELKTRDKSSFKVVEDTSKVAAPALRVEMGQPAYGTPGAKGGTDTEIRDIFNEVNKVTSMNDRVSKNKGAPLNELSASAQGIILKYARDLTGQDLDQRDIFVAKQPDGNIYILDAKKGTRIAPINFEDINLQANKGVKSQQKILSSEPQKTSGSDWKSRAKKVN